MVDEILFRGDLVLDSAMHIGAPDADSPLGAAPCRVDGHGVPYIPGASLAGAFIETLRNSGLFDSELESERSWVDELTLKIRPEGPREDRGRASRLAIRAAYPLLGTPSRIVTSPELLPVALPRERVAIDGKDGRARDELKFAQVEVAPGLRFRLLMSLDLLDADEATAAILIRTVEAGLALWTHFAQLGGHASSGCGWARLENLERCDVSGSNIEAYLDADDLRVTHEAGLFESVPSDEIATALQGLSPEQVPLVALVELRVGRRRDGYGWESSLIGGLDSIWAGDDCDRLPVWREVGAAERPEEGWPRQRYVPGSSLKGACRHLLNRLGADSEVVLRVFGSIANTQEEAGSVGSCWFGDLSPADVLISVRLERHTEDELAAGTLGGEKFNEQPIFRGTFRGQLVCVSSDTNDRSLFKEFCAALQNLTAAGAFSLGAHSTRPELVIGQWAPIVEVEPRTAPAKPVNEETAAGATLVDAVKSAVTEPESDGADVPEVAMDADAGPARQQIDELPTGLAPPRPWWKRRLDWVQGLLKGAVSVEEPLVDPSPDGTASKLVDTSPEPPSAQDGQVQVTPRVRPWAGAKKDGPVSRPPPREPVTLHAYRPVGDVTMGWVEEMVELMEGPLYAMGQLQWSPERQLAVGTEGVLPPTFFVELGEIRSDLGALCAEADHLLIFGEHEQLTVSNRAEQAHLLSEREVVQAAGHQAETQLCQVWELYDSNEQGRIYSSLPLKSIATTHERYAFAKRIGALSVPPGFESEVWARVYVDDGGVVAYRLLPPLERSND